MSTRINWTRDEYILALDLYLKYPATAPAKTDAVLTEYSNYMRSLHPSEALADPSFRNENGVYLRLMNFRAVDPYWTSQGKVGMTSGKVGKCKEIWDEFAETPEVVAELANQIKTEISLSTQTSGDATTVDTPSFLAQEGRLILTKHYRRERSPKLRKQKLQQQRETEGFNYCEACNENASRYSCEPDKILEVHHSVPLHHAETAVETKLEDLMILCANCHRAIHAIGSPKDASELFN